MNLRFSIADWAAWAPGLANQTAWWTQFSDPNSTWEVTDAVAPVPELSPMTRRRLNRVGRSALQVAFATHKKVSTGPVIFASRYGDLERSVALLSALANNESLSPTAFSVSVHNAIGAIFSIEQGDTENYSALAAGVNTVPCALLEANALLDDGAASVMLVVYEDPLPEIYASNADAPQIPYAWACRIVPADSTLGVVMLSKHVDFVEANDPANFLPADLAVLRFIASVAIAQRGANCEVETKFLQCAAPILDAHGWRYTRA